MHCGCASPTNYLARVMSFFIYSLLYALFALTLFHRACSATPITFDEVSPPSTLALQHPSGPVELGANISLGFSLSGGMPTAKPYYYGITWEIDANLVLPNGSESHLITSFFPTHLKQDICASAEGPSSDSISSVSTEVGPKQASLRYYPPSVGK